MFFEPATDPCAGSKKDWLFDRNTYAVVSLQVVDVLAEHQRPEVLAHELDDVERVVEARPVPREPSGSG